MMLLRRLAALAIVVVAPFALYRLVFVPWRCNNIEGAVNRSLDIDGSLAPTGDFRLRDTAERNLRMLQACLDRCKTDVNLPVLAGANLLVLGRTEAAAQLYQRALQYDHRPEIYLALATAQSYLGQRDAAVANAVRGADFVGMEPLANLPDGLVRSRAYEIVGSRREHLRAQSGRPPSPNVIANGTFAEPGPNGPAVRVDGYAYAPSAAKQWELVNPFGSTTTQLVPSTRRPGGKAIHVTTTRELSGLRQKWEADSRRRVRTTVWVFVNRGRVSVGSGTGQTQMVNAVSKTTGQWEKLEGINESCPATLTQIQAADTGADFIVDEVVVRETIAAPPCDR